MQRSEEKKKEMQRSEEKKKKVIHHLQRIVMCFLRLFCVNVFREEGPGLLLIGGRGAAVARPIVSGRFGPSNPSGSSREE